MYRKIWVGERGEKPNHLFLLSVLLIDNVSILDSFITVAYPNIESSCFVTIGVIHPHSRYSGSITGLRDRHRTELNAFNVMQKTVTEVSRGPLEVILGSNGEAPTASTEYGHIHIPFDGNCLSQFFVKSDQSDS
ncbi:predicted protein [Aspergillus terreus NIH2624]|uniref:Uncharacterized protein n=1 Tax=Aspergillus terreus (strain NIH 2624 / FGSC A1156) TaxID=341663 RepID=Q0CHS8_ASPTN|nr:uncharacterized protein ATEG_06756 [Aspergillus terreus NIH2624]EAU33300.1 predicted protein [Aspergillus terreus NIH2624]